jgi:hypothetical protein
MGGGRVSARYIVYHLTGSVLDIHKIKETKRKEVPKGE